MLGPIGIAPSKLHIVSLLYIEIIKQLTPLNFNNIGLRLRLSVTMRPFTFPFATILVLLGFGLAPLRLILLSLIIAGSLTPSTLLGKSVIFGRNMVLFAIDSAEFDKLLRLSALGPVDSLRLGGKSLESCPRFWPRELLSQVSLNKFRGIGYRYVVTV